MKMIGFFTSACLMIASQALAESEVAKHNSDADWTGFYVGAQYVKRDFAAAGFEFDAKGRGVHGGYLHDFGDFVLGAELGIDKAEYSFSPMGPSTTQKASLDSNSLMLIAGYDLGRFLPYATLGLASLDGTRTDADFAYGLGVTYQAAEHVRIGLEFRNVDISNYDDIGVDFNTNSLSAKVSYNF